MGRSLEDGIRVNVNGAPKTYAMQYSSKSDVVCAVLRELIISGELEPSEPLRQRDLADRFGVSQTPVREALRRLESEGLVVNDPHRGATVAGSRSGGQEDNIQIRASLEALGARLASRGIPPDRIRSLRAINDLLESLPEGDPEYAVLNRRFHFAVYEVAESPVLLSMMRLLWQAMPAGPKVARSQEDSCEEHRRLTDALASHDSEAAAAITFEHITGSKHLPSEFRRAGGTS